MHTMTFGSEQSPTLLLLHGAGACDCFCNQYAALSEHFRLFIPHLPGAGEAVGELYARESTLSALAEYVDELAAQGPIAVVGHSVGAELAVALAARQPSRFNRAVFLSPWVCATKQSCAVYTRMAKLATASLRCGALVRLQGRYWGYSEAQAQYMAQYSAKITPEQYAAWFSYENRVHLSEEVGYKDIAFPMLAVCGRSETAETIRSVDTLGRLNVNCAVVKLRGNHDYPQRSPGALNPLLLDFLLKQA
ncbi:MAG: alpha/beta fold hydrolase [Oscillospiraceae bacterium]|nr:alpha/beta fold hydrolase [Oscillospiraceae bacterium]